MRLPSLVNEERNLVCEGDPGLAFGGQESRVVFGSGSNRDVEGTFLSGDSKCRNPFWDSLCRESVQENSPSKGLGDGPSETLGCLIEPSWATISPSTSSRSSVVSLF